MTSPDNPYVGPRTFTEQDGEYYFGREQEARDLTARIVSEHLLLFYAQSGAGKSSLINTRVIPRLRDEEGFIVLPVGRVSGELPRGVEGVQNIYAFNLMNSLDQSSGNVGRLAGVQLTDFLARLAGETAVDDAGKRTTHWVYKPDLAIDRGGAAHTAGPRFVLVIDQFEEIITGNPEHWQEREAFFRQLNQALLDDPNLWVVLTLREDYVAALDPYAPLVLNRMRARFYMERMDEEDALDAVRKPAELAGRPFAPGVAEALVNDLRQVRVPGSEETVPSQYVEPVQLQVVCYQMWENLEHGGGGTQITAEDLEESGDVDQALSEFYEQTLHAVLAQPGCEDLDERQLRGWFDRELITAAGTRGLVHMGKNTTAGLPNEVVRLLQQRFLVRSELRAGAPWVELVHDRFVKPIHESNTTWFEENLSVLQRQALLWDREDRPPDLLLRGQSLREAFAWVKEQKQPLQEYEEDFLTAAEIADQAAAVREKRRTRLIAALAVLAMIVAGIALVLFGYAQREALNANLQSTRAVENAALAQEQAEKAATEAALALAARSEAVYQADRSATLAAEAVLREEDARAQEAAAETARAEAESALGTAVAAQNNAVGSKAQAESAGTVAAGALETSGAILELILTEQAAQEAVSSGNVVVADAAPADVLSIEDLPIIEAPIVLGSITFSSIGIPLTGGGGSISVPDLTTPAAGATPTLTPAVTATPSLTPTATPTLTSAQVLSAQLDSIKATQTRLAGGMAAAEEAPEVEVVANWIPMTLYAQASDAAPRVTVVRPWDSARVLDTEGERWLHVETADGVEGWVDGRLRVFTGDADGLPGALSYRVISDREDLPFVFGEVTATTQADDQYQLRYSPAADAESIIEVPVGTEVILLQANQGQDYNWVLVTLADIGGDRLIRTGYLPQQIVEETEPFFTLLEEGQLVSETGVVSCLLEAGEVVTAVNDARLWSEPDAASGEFLAALADGDSLLITAADPVWGPIRRDVNFSGWWWLAEATDGTRGWIWQDRLEECGQ